MEDESNLWDIKAEDWDKQVGDHGDYNRQMSSDQVLWKRLGEVSGLDILDAGCGTGYLSRILCKKGARVIAVDYSKEMIRVARDRSSGYKIDYRVESCESLTSVEDQSIDKIVSNYVLMDLADLKSTGKNFHRVLRSGGKAVLVFSHPCFPQSDDTRIREDGSVFYRWENSYFENRRIRTGPWGRFTTDFVYYQRPLGEYWRVFRDAGFSVNEIDEPHPEHQTEGMSPSQFANFQMRPFSIVFTLEKP